MARTFYPTELDYSQLELLESSEVLCIQGASVVGSLVHLGQWRMHVQPMEVIYECMEFSPHD